MALIMSSKILMSEVCVSQMLFQECKSPPGEAVIIMITRSSHSQIIASFEINDDEWDIIKHINLNGMGLINTEWNLEILSKLYHSFSLTCSN